MKLVIEVNQETPNVAPTVTVSVDGEPIGLIQQIEFRARSEWKLPKCLIHFPKLDKMLALDPDVKATVLELQRKAALAKDKLKDFKAWLEVR